MGLIRYPYSKDDGSGNPIFTNRDLTQLIGIEKGTALTTIYGSDTTLDDLIFKANSVDSYSYFKLHGSGIIEFRAHGASVFYSDAIAYMVLQLEGGYSKIKTSDNKDLGLLPDGTGAVRFGTYTAGAASDSTGYITIKDAAGTTRKLMVQA